MTFRYLWKRKSLNLVTWRSTFALEFWCMSGPITPSKSSMGQRISVWVWAAVALKWRFIIPRGGFCSATPGSKCIHNLKVSMFTETPRFGRGEFLSPLAIVLSFISLTRLERDRHRIIFMTFIMRTTLQVCKQLISVYICNFDNFLVT